MNNTLTQDMKDKLEKHFRYPNSTLLQKTKEGKELTEREKVFSVVILGFNTLTVGMTYEEAMDYMIDQVLDGVCRLYNDEKAINWGLDVSRGWLQKTMGVNP